jgi:hypothetical protein
MEIALTLRKAALKAIFQKDLNLIIILTFATANKANKNGASFSLKLTPLFFSFIFFQYFLNCPDCISLEALFMILK